MRRLPLLLGIAVLLLGVALLATVVGAVTHDDERPPRHAAAISDTAPTDAVVAPAPRPARRERAAIPVRVEIPSIGVRAPVIKLGLNPDSSLEVPKDFGDTGWWSGGPRPGEPGPAVIVGHVDSYSGPAVFYRLRELRRGDTIVVVGRDGSRARFTVEGSEQYPKDDFPTARVYGRTNGPTLRLITCGGDFDSSTAITSTTRSSTRTDPQADGRSLRMRSSAFVAWVRREMGILSPSQRRPRRG